MSAKDDRSTSIVHHSVGAFLSGISEPGALITITKVEVRDKGKSVAVFITVYPDSKEAEVLKRLKRERSNLREYVKTHERLFHLPIFDFKIDYGEKNRQHIDGLATKSPLAANQKTLEA